MNLNDLKLDLNNLSNREHVVPLHFEVLYTKQSDLSDDLFTTLFSSMFSDIKEVADSYDTWIHNVIQNIEYENGLPVENQFKEFASEPINNLIDDVFNYSIVKGHLSEDNIRQLKGNIYVQTHLWETYPEWVIALLVYRLCVQHIRFQIKDVNILRLFITCQNTRYKLIDEYDPTRG